MGLGPLICPECMVYAKLEQDEHQDGYGPREYVCPACGNDHTMEYLWMFTEDEQKTIESNTRFYRFVEGKE